MINESIIDLNNRTIALLQQQDFAQAIQHSSLVLRRHRELYQTSSPRHVSSGDDCLDTYMLLSKIDESRQYADRTFIYDHGIVIPASADAYSSMVAAILIFNCALAHQLFAQHTFYNDCSRRHLWKAKLLYELAHRFCREDLSFLFHFVVLNNIAMIEAKIGETEVSAQRFEHLLASLMVMVDRGNTERVRHVQGFLANVITTDTAPAA